MGESNADLHGLGRQEASAAGRHLRQPSPSFRMERLAMTLKPDEIERLAADLREGADRLHYVYEGAWDKTIQRMRQAADALCRQAQSASKEAPVTDAEFEAEFTRRWNAYEGPFALA